MTSREQVELASLTDINLCDQYHGVRKVISSGSR